MDAESIRPRRHREDALGLDTLLCKGEKVEPCQTGPPAQVSWTVTW
jgi:hypothetical protein